MTTNKRKKTYAHLYMLKYAYDILFFILVIYGFQAHSNLVLTQWNASYLSVYSVKYTIQLRWITIQHTVYIHTKSSNVHLSLYYQTIHGQVSGPSPACGMASMASTWIAYKKFKVANFSIYNQKIKKFMNTKLLRI